jgi:hypothetical protein
MDNEYDLALVKHELETIKLQQFQLNGKIIPDDWKV